jgi:hypothetical protein
MAVNKINPVGSRIDAFGILGEERDISGKVVGVDVELHADNGHLFFVNIQTKEQFTAEIAEGAIETYTKIKDIEDASTVMDGVEEELRPSFIFNDREITPELLQAKLIGRVILEDLAASLFPIDQAD